MSYISIIIPSDLGPCISVARCASPPSLILRYIVVCAHTWEDWALFGADQTVYSRPATIKVLEIQDYSV